MAFTLATLQTDFTGDDSHLERTLENAEKSAARLRDSMGRFAKQGSDDAQKALPPLEAAFRQLGVESQQSLDKAAAEARQAFNVIAQSGTATTRELQQAWDAQEKAAKIAAAGGEKAFAAQEAAARKAAAEVQRNTLTWDKFRDKVQSAGQTLERTGTSLSIGITAPLTLLAKKVFDVGVQYEQSMNIFQAVTKATADEMGKAAQVAQALGADMTLPATSAADAAAAMTELAKGGFTAQQAMEAARGTLQLAAAAQIDEAQAATITANAINAFKLEAADAGRVSDLLAASANASSAEITDMALGFAQSSASAAAMKVPIQDLATALSLMANNAIKGSDAGTSFKTFLAALTPTTDKAARAMQALGIHAFDAKGNFVGLEAIIKQAAPALARMTDEQRNLAIRTAFGSDAMRAANIILGEGVEGFNKLRGAVTEQGAAAELAGAKTKGLGGAMQGLLSQLETLALNIFNAVKGPLEDLVRKVADAAGELGNLDTRVVKAGVAFLGVAAAGGPIALVIGKLLQIGPAGVAITGAIVAVSLIAAAYASNFADMQSVLDRFAGNLSRALGSSKTDLNEWGKLWTQVGIYATEALDIVLTRLSEAIVAIKTAAVATAQALEGDLQGMGQTIRSGWAELEKIESGYQESSRKRIALHTALQLGGWEAYHKELIIQEQIAGALAPKGFLDSYDKNNPMRAVLADLFQKAPDFKTAVEATMGGGARGGTAAFNSAYKGNDPIASATKEVEAGGPSFVTKIINFHRAAAIGAKTVWDLITKGSPFFIIHDLMNAVAFAATLPPAFEKHGAGIAQGFKRGVSKGKPSKAIFDEFESGITGLEKAIDLVIANLGNKDIFSAISKSAKPGMEKLKEASKEATAAIEQYLEAVGTKVKLTEERLLGPNGLGEKLAKDLLQGALGFARLKDSIETINATRGIHGLGLLDESLKITQRTAHELYLEFGDDFDGIAQSLLDTTKVIEIPFNTFKRLTPELIKDVERAGFVFRQVFPGIAKDVTGAIAPVLDFREVLKLAKETANDFAERSGLDFDLWTNKVLADFKKISDAAPHWAGPIVDESQRIKDALENNVTLVTAQAELSIRNNVQSMIGTFEQLAESMGLTGQRFQDFVEQKIRATLANVKDITAAETEAIVEKWKQELFKLPGIYEQVFGKLPSATKKVIGDIVGIIDTLPGEVGNTLRKVQSQFEQWLTFIDKIFAALSNLISGFPSSLQDALGKVFGVFKTSTQAAQITIQSATGAIAGDIHELGAILSTGQADWTEAWNKIAVGTEDSSKQTVAAITAIGSAVGLLGQLVGGRAGSAISGAGTGLAIGAQIGSIVPGIGTGIGAAIGAIGGFFAGLFGGGKSAAQKEQERLALEKARTDAKLQAEALKQAYQDSLQKTIESFRLGREFLESLTFYSRVPKEAFAAFFADMHKLLKFISDESKKFTKETAEQAKAFAEGFGAGIQLVAATPLAIQAINQHIPLAEGKVEAWSKDWEALLRMIGVVAESIPDKLQKEAKKLGTRMQPPIDLFNQSVTGIKEAFDLKPLPPESLSIWERSIDLIITGVGNLSEKFDKVWLKSLAFFSEKAQAGLAFWREGVGAVKDMVDTTIPSEAQIISVFKSIAFGLQTGIALAATVSAEGLTQAEMVALKALAIFAAIKAAVEAFAALRDYQSLTGQVFEALGIDFRSAVTWLTAFVGFGERIAELAVEFRDYMTDAATALKEGVAKLKDVAQVAASALSGLTVGAAGGAFDPSILGGSSLVVSRGAPTAFAAPSYLATPPSYSSTSFTQTSSGRSGPMEVHLHFSAGSVTQTLELDSLEDVDAIKSLLDKLMPVALARSG